MWQTLCGRLRLRYNLLLQPACLVADEQQQLLQRQQQHVLHCANLQQVCAVCVCHSVCPAGRQKLRCVKSIYICPSLPPAPLTPSSTTHRTLVLGEHSRPWQFCGENGKFLFDYLLHLVNFHVPGDKNCNNLLSHGPRPWKPEESQLEHLLEDLSMCSSDFV